MEFWIYIFIMEITTPIVMLICGRYFREKLCDQMNPAVGYRTPMSMKNADTWKFAHQYCGKLWTNLGIILIPVSILPMLFVINGDHNTVGWTGTAICIIQSIVLLCSIIPVEKALKKAFDENGNRK